VPPSAIKNESRRLLLTLLFLYLVAGILQLFASRAQPSYCHLPRHSRVLFGVIHGARIYRSRGIVVFAALCRGVGARFESVSLRTGFPFGHQGVIALHAVQRFRMMT
jgi:hypothetical protein